MQTNPGLQSLAMTDQNNNPLRTINNQPAYWDATAAAVRYTGMYLCLRNFYFGRISGAMWTGFNFIGYRIMY